MNNRFEDQPIENPPTTEDEQSIDKPDETESTVASLIEHSLFYDQPELHAATTAIINGLTDPDTDTSQLKSAWNEYAKIVERIVEYAEEAPENPQSYARTQIEAIIHKALIFKSAGNTLRYLEELDRSEVYAYNEGLDEMSTTINNEMAAIVETLNMSPDVLILKLKGIISEDNREFLRDLIDEGGDFEDMINHAYSMVLEEGGDPDEILAEIGVLDRKGNL